MGWTPAPTPAHFELACGLSVDGFLSILDNPPSNLVKPKRDDAALLSPRSDSHLKAKALPGEIVESAKRKAEQQDSTQGWNSSKGGNTR